MGTGIRNRIYSKTKTANYYYGEDHQPSNLNLTLPSVEIDPHYLRQKETRQYDKILR